MLKSFSAQTNALGALNYKGTWDATANSPALASSVGTKGDYYVVGTAGSTTLNGISNWGIGDWAVFNGSVWQRVEGGADLNGVNLTVSGNTTLSGPVSVTPTWNAGATVFTGIGMNVTDTASASGSLLFDLQVAGVSQFHVTKGGANHLKRSNYNIASANTAIITASNYSLTGSNADSMLDLSGTWNTSGTPTVIKTNITDTASNAASLLLDLQVGGSSKFSVSKNGLIGIGSTDVVLTRDAADILAQRRGTTAQAFRVYNTYTDASNFERVQLYTSGTSGGVGWTQAGSGLARNFLVSGNQLVFQTGSSYANRWIISSSGHFVAAADNTYDIGASGAERPRNIYFAGGLIGGYIQAAASVGISWVGRSSLTSPSDSVITLGNATNTDFNRLNFGGTTNSFGAVARDGAGISIVGAAGGSTAHIKVPGVTVANLPAAATAGAGARSFVTDATAPVFGSAVVGGGAVNVPVYSTGAAWNVG